jgi:hypothetical protein
MAANDTLSRMLARMSGKELDDDGNEVGPNQSSMKDLKDRRAAAKEGENRTYADAYARVTNPASRERSSDADKRNVGEQVGRLRQESAPEVAAVERNQIDQAGRQESMAEKSRSVESDLDRVSAEADAQWAKEDAQKEQDISRKDSARYLAASSPSKLERTTDAEQRNGSPNTTIAAPAVDDARMAALFKTANGGDFDPKSRTDRQKMAHLKLLLDKDPELAKQSDTKIALAWYRTM